MSKLRFASIEPQAMCSGIEQVRRYLPDNYSAVQLEHDLILLVGRDVQGWTLDGYVIPRLASGLIFAKEEI